VVAAVEAMGTAAVVTDAHRLADTPAVMEQATLADMYHDAA
jgi:hypothetical protein